MVRQRPLKPPFEGSNPSSPAIRFIISPSMQNIFKSIGAILAGFVTVFVLSTLTDVLLQLAGVLPQAGPLFDVPLLLLAISYRTVYTVLGGYVASRLAPNHRMRHAIILGCIGMIAGSIGAVMMAEYGPAWYAWGLVVEALPCTWLGAKLVRR